MYYGGDSIPYGNLIDGFKWDYSEWQTVYYEAKPCYNWNGQSWIGESPEYPTWTVCGLSTCTLCSSQVLSEEKWVTVFKEIPTDMKIQVLGAKHEAYIVLKLIQHSTAYPNLYVDIEMLTEGLTPEQIALLRSTQNVPHGHYCCYKPGGTGNQGGIEPLINGFARIIIHSQTHGIEIFEEGHF